MRRSCVLLLLLSVAGFGQARYRFGDDPRWAAPDFNDREWQQLESPVLADRTRANELVWIRSDVSVPANRPVNAILWPPDCGIVSAPAELFINGVRVASLGRIAPDPDVHQLPSTCVFPVPRNLLQPGKPATAAIRAWYLGPIAAGVIAGNRELLDERAGKLRARRQIGLSLETTRAVLLLLLGIALQVTWRVTHGERLLFWFSLWLTTEGFVSLVDCIQFMWPESRTVRVIRLQFAPLDIVEVSSMINFAWTMFGVRSRWLRWIAYVCFFAVSAIYASFAISTATLQLRFVLVPILFAIGWVIAFSTAIRALRRRGDERLVGIAIIGAGLCLVGLSLPPPLQLPINFSVGPFTIYVISLGWTIFGIGVSIVLFRRTWRRWRRSERVEAEIEAARTVQSALMPAEPPSVPGFTIEAVYLPAEEVGGDFYRVFPSEDASTVLITGDVSGKGLKAAMIVSMVDGALEAVVHETTDPAQLLARLNRVLLRRLGGGFVTCCCLRVQADGNYTLANAGHLPPYVSGRLLAVESGLPLGIDRDAIWTETAGVLGPGETIVLVSDGVVEARRSGGELYGFERVEADLADFHGAAALADKAREFGQDDDITVLAITRREAGAHAA